MSMSKAGRERGSDVTEALRRTEVDKKNVFVHLLLYHKVLVSQNLVA